MRWLMLGLLLGTLAAVLLERLHLGAKMEAVQTASRNALAAEAEPPSGRLGERGGETHPDDLSQLTRQELYRRAQSAGIVGRSQMSKEQLIAALRDGAG